jgi:hypothetical protein
MPKIERKDMRPRAAIVVPSLDMRQSRAFGPTTRDLDGQSVVLRPLALPL